MLTTTAAPTTSTPTTIAMTLPIAEPTPAPTAAASSNTSLLTNIIVTVLACVPSKCGKVYEQLASFGVDKPRIAFFLAPYDMGEEFKDALTKAGYTWWFHGSKFMGHDFVPKEFTGAGIVLDAVDDAKEKIAKAFASLGYKVVYQDRVHRSELFIHDMAFPKLLELLSVDFRRIIEWRNLNLTAEQRHGRPRSYSNPVHQHRQYQSVSNTNPMAGMATPVYMAPASSNVHAGIPEESEDVLEIIQKDTYLPYAATELATGAFSSSAPSTPTGVTTTLTVDSPRGLARAGQGIAARKRSKQA